MPGHGQSSCSAAFHLKPSALTPEEGGSRVKVVCLSCSTDRLPSGPGREGGCWAGVLVGYRMVDCLFFKFPGISVSDNDRKRGRSPQGLAALGLGEQQLVGPRGQLFFKIPDRSTAIFDSGNISKQERRSTSSCHLVGPLATL